MSSDMYPSYMTEGTMGNDRSVVAYAPASSANLSVGFDVLGQRSPPWMALCSAIGCR